MPSIVPAPPRLTPAVLTLLAACLGALALATAGCGGENASQSESQQTQVVSATTEETEQSPTTEAKKPKAATKTVRDRRGDTKAPDLDIIRATVSRDTDLVRVTMTLAQAPTDDVIYSGMLTCGDQVWQLGYKRAAGTTTIFAYDFGGVQHEAQGDTTGRTVSIAYSAANMGCTGALDFQLVAEGTNDRGYPDPMSDYVPEPGPDALNPKRIHLP